MTNMNVDVRNEKMLRVTAPDNHDFYMLEVGCLVIFKLI